MVAYGAAQTREEERSFVQARLRTFGKASAVLTLLGFGVQLASTLGVPVDGGAQVLLLSGFNVLVSVGFWWFMRGRPHSLAVLRVAEVAVLLAATVLTVSMVRLVMVVLLNLEASGGPPAHGGRMALAFSEMLGLSFVFCLRAAFVPSEPRYSAAVTASAAPFLLTGLALLWPALPGEHVVRETVLDRETASIATNVVIWWSLLTIVCTVITSVVHGLRKEVRAARQLGQYVLEAKIGEGGMGTVYRARHAMMKRPTAVKLLPPDRSGDEQVQRFEREVQHTARLSHPNTIRIYDYGRTDDGVFFYAMELLDGATLAQLVELAGPMDPSRATRVLAAIASALVEAHAEGLVHRDIKPSNIILCRQGGMYDVPKLLDFGLVKQLASSSAAPPHLTADNQITGTPLYMSPEAVRSPESLDARGDLYSLGAVAYYLLTGEHVFVRGTVVEVLAAHLNERPEGISERLGAPIDAGLEALVLACLDKDPAGRPQSAAEFLNRLEALEVEPWTAADATRWWREWGSDLADEPAPLGADEAGATFVARR